jgi:glycosyltransferase involved in cell wall biosynthesis
VSFLFGMLASLWIRRHSYALASIAVFSGPAFTWAEAAAELLCRLGKPFVAQLHGGGLPVFAQKSPHRVKRLLDSAAAVTAPSRYLQESMRPYHDDIRLLPNAIDVPAYPFRARANPKPHLVWLRAFHAIYNPSLALKVLIELVREHPESKLTMVGPDKDDGSLPSFRSTAKELQLENHIEYAGLVRKTEVPAWLDRGDVFINTSSFDNTPVSVIEAMACGLCVTSTNVGGISYLLEHEHDALLVPPNDAAAMAAAVKRVLTEPGLGERLSRNARRKVEGFDWHVTLPQWESLFEEALAHAQPFSGPATSEPASHRPEEDGP